MKKQVTSIIFLIVVLFGVRSALADAKWFACKVAEDCALSEGGCDVPYAINKNFEKEFSDFKKHKTCKKAIDFNEAKKVFVASCVDRKCKAVPRSIDALVKKLSERHGLWKNGMFPKLDLPESAQVETVLSKVFKMSGFDKGHIKKYSALDMKKVQIDNEIYTAVLIDSDLGKKVILIQYDRTSGWWTRVYGEEFLR